MTILALPNGGRTLALRVMKNINFVEGFLFFLTMHSIYFKMCRSREDFLWLSTFSLFDHFGPALEVEPMLWGQWNTLPNHAFTLSSKCEGMDNKIFLNFAIFRNISLLLETKGYNDYGNHNLWSSHPYRASYQIRRQYWPSS